MSEARGPVRLTAKARGSRLFMHLISSLERARTLDRLSEAGQRVARLLPPGRARDVRLAVSNCPERAIELEES